MRLSGQTCGALLGLLLGFLDVYSIAAQIILAGRVIASSVELPLLKRSPIPAGRAGESSGSRGGDWHGGGSNSPFSPSQTKRGESFNTGGPSSTQHREEHHRRIIPVAHRERVTHLPFGVDYKRQLLGDISGSYRWPNPISSRVGGESSSASSTSSEADDEEDEDELDSDDDEEEEEEDGDSDGNGNNEEEVQQGQGNDQQEQEQAEPSYQDLVHEHFQQLHLGNAESSLHHQHQDQDGEWRYDQEGTDVEEQRRQSQLEKRYQRAERTRQAAREYLEAQRARLEVHLMDGLRSELDDLLQIPGINDGFFGGPLAALTQEQAAAVRVQRVEEELKLIEDVQREIDENTRSAARGLDSYSPSSQQSAPRSTRMPPLQNERANALRRNYNTQVSLLERCLRQKAVSLSQGLPTDTIDHEIFYHARIARETFRMIQRRMHLLQEKYGRRVRRVRGETRAGDDQRLD